MRMQGLTLPELLIALAITSILLLSTHPIGSLLEKQRLLNASQQLVSTIRFARSKAVTAQSGVTVLATDGNWGKGWQVFFDTNRNAQLDAGEGLIAKRASSLQLRISGNTQVASYVHFSAQGFPELTSGGFQAGSIVFCSPNSTLQSIKMVLGSSGRIRTEEQPSSACTITES